MSPIFLRHSVCLFVNLYPGSPDTAGVAGGVVVLLHPPARDLAVAVLPLGEPGVGGGEAPGGHVGGELHHPALPGPGGEGEGKVLILLT